METNQGDSIKRIVLFETWIFGEGSCTFISCPHPFDLQNLSIMFHSDSPHLHKDLQGYHNYSLVISFNFFHIKVAVYELSYTDIHVKEFLCKCMAKS